MRYLCLKYKRYLSTFISKKNFIVVEMSYSKSNPNLKIKKVL